MKRIRKIALLLSIIAFTFLGRTLFSQQYILTGKVVNKNNQPIEFVNIHVSKNDTLFLKPIYSDSLGQFSLQVEQGNYTISIQQFGKYFFNKNLELNQDIDLGSIEVDEGVGLDAIEITAIRKIIIDRVDKTTINVKQQQIFEGDNALSILGKIQSIAIINDRILYDGATISALKINNRNINFNSQKEMMDFLKNLDNKAINKIEIIHANAKFSASNAGKILNIILDQPLLDGFSLNPKMTYSQGIYSDKDFNIFSQLKRGKISSNIFLSYGINKDYNKQNSEIYYKMMNEFQEQNNKSIIDLQPFNLNIELQYDINPNTYIGAAVKYNTMKFDNLVNSIVNLYNNNDQGSTFNNRNHLNIDGKYYTTSLYFNKKLDSLGQNLRLELNYNRYTTRNEQFLTNEVHTIRQPEFTQRILRKVYLPNISLDYDRKIVGETNLSIGLLYYTMDNEENREVVNHRENEFDYSEKVFAHYVSVLGKTKYFSYQIGLRGETTSNLYKNYYDLFPSFSLRKDFKKANVQMSYNKSITRPTGYMLSPNLIYHNKYFARVGDSELLSVMRDLLSSTFSYKAWRLTATYSIYNNSIDVLQRIDDSDPRLVINQYINIKEKSQADFTFSYNYKRKDIVVTPLIYYALGYFRLEEQSEKIRNHFRFFNISTSYTMTKTNRIDGGFRYFFKNNQLYTTTKPRHAFDLTYNKSFISNKLNFQFFIKDLFRGSAEKSMNVLSSIEKKNDEYKDSRQLGLSIRYTFSSGDKIKVDGTKKNVNRK